MEGVGARLGRSSTRYGPATVFTGPVRRWKKKWVHVSPSAKKDNSSSASAATVVNGGSATDGSNGSHLLLYKWSPLSQGSNGNGNGNEDGKSESDSPSEDHVAAAAAEDPPRRRFKYVPIAVLEEQNKEITEIEEDDKVEEDDKIEVDEKVEEDDKVEVDDMVEEIEKVAEEDKVEEDDMVEEVEKVAEDEKVEEDKSAAESSEKKTEVEEKPDINDVPMEDNQEEEKVVRQDLNESTMDLGLNLNAKEADPENKVDEPLEEA